MSSFHGTMYGLFKVGNSSLWKNIIVFNITSVKNCPAKSMCLFSDICYANKAENRWKQVLPYRLRQEKYWDQVGVMEFINDIMNVIERRKKDPIEFFRFNECGDFRNQKDITKLDLIAKHLKKKGVITYGYTARKDLDFRGVSFKIRGSGFRLKDGKTIVIKKGEKTELSLCPKTVDSRIKCGKCKQCMTTRKSIAFKKH